MAKRVRLIATQGCDEANHGAERFRVWNDGHIDVPPLAVAPLLEKGGFVLASEQPDDGADDTTPPAA